MNQRVSIILLIALAVAGCTSYLVYRSLTRGAAAGPPSAQIVVAARPLEIGTLIKEADLQIGTWHGKAPEGMATKIQPLIGRGVMAPIFAGEPVMESRLAAPGAGGGLAITIPPGMRAVAVKVDEIVGVAGFVLPGMRVDVLITGLPPGAQRDNAQVRTVLQNIQVLSAGQNYQKDSEGKPVKSTAVNLLVTPEQAEILALSSNETRIQLVLRNPLDTEAATPPGTATANLFGAVPVKPASTPEPPKARKPRPVPVAVALQTSAPPRITIEVYNAGKRTESNFAASTEVGK